MSRPLCTLPSLPMDPCPLSTRVIESTAAAAALCVLQVGFARAELNVLCEGFFELLPADVLRGDDYAPTLGGLTALDLELICAGLPGIAIDDWMQHTVWLCQGKRLALYEYTELREIFFAVLTAMDLDERARVLSFACGSGRLVRSLW